MRHELRTQIDIEAPVDEVWRQLTDLTAYEEWNPFIVSAAGSVAVGERPTLRLKQPGSPAIRIRPRFTEVAPGAVLEWLGHLGVPGLFDGRHRFELTATPSGGTLFVQRESFSGLLVRPLRRSLDAGTRAGFEAMNTALRDRVQGAHSPG